MKGQPQASKLGPAYFAHGCFTTIFERAGKFRLITDRLRVNLSDRVFFRSMSADFI
jgi:hypothetical protein